MAFCATGIARAVRMAGIAAQRRFQLRIHPLYQQNAAVTISGIRTAVMIMLFFIYVVFVKNRTKIILFSQW